MNDLVRLTARHVVELLRKGEITPVEAVHAAAARIAAGLPVGLQILAPRAQEASLLSAAALFEPAMAIKQSVPMDPIVRHQEVG